MGSLWQTPAVVVVLVTWLTATPVSLADISRREALRRQATPASTSMFTNDDLPTYVPSAVSGVDAVRSAPVDADDAVDAEATPDAQEPEPGPEPVRDEQWWRQRMARARSVLSQNQALLATGVQQVNSLQAQFVSLSDPAAREQVRQEFATIRAHVQNLENVVTGNEQAIRDIEAEAIQAGVPIEWISSSNGGGGRVS